MKRRDQVIDEAPRRNPWVRVNVQGLAGVDRPLVMLAPSLGRLHALIGPWNDALQANDFAAAEIAAAAFIMECWADHEFKLTGADASEVARELHMDGWTFDGMVALIAGISKRVMGSAPTEDEVAARVSFFDETGAGELPASI